MIGLLVDFVANDDEYSGSPTTAKPQLDFIRFLFLFL